MKIIKNFFLIMMISVLLIFSACGDDSDPAPGSYNPYVGGTEAVTASFLSGMPPDALGSLLDGGQTPFAVGIEITNNGEFDINADSENDFFQVELVGINEGSFGLTADDLVVPLNMDLRGVRKNNVDGSIIRGQKTQLVIDNLNYLNEVTGNTPFTMTMAMCYDYGTKSSTRICIADDVTKATFNEDDRAICLVEAQKNVINSAGPVQVVNVVESPGGKNKVDISFEIQKTGSGKLFLYESNNPCKTSNDVRDTLNRVKVVVSMPEYGGMEFECFGFEKVGQNYEKIVNLYEEDRSPAMRCTIIGDENDDRIYEDTMDIDLYYRYGHNIKKDITIKHGGSIYE